MNGHWQDLAVLKINALYFIKDNWDEIKLLKKFKELRKVYHEAFLVIEQYLSYNDPKNPVIIPYKIILNRDKKSGLLGYYFDYSPRWKFSLIKRTFKEKPARIHGGMKPGNLILSIENKSLDGISNFDAADKLIMNEVASKACVTFVLNIAMSKETFNKIKN